MDFIIDKVTTDKAVIFTQTQSKKAPGQDQKLLTAELRKKNIYPPHKQP